MARRRPLDAPDAEYDLTQPPPKWTARWLWALRWGEEYRPPLPRSRAQAYRTVYCAGPIEPALARIQRWWADDDEEYRRRLWADDNEPWPSWQEALTPCRHHDQYPGYCGRDCPTVVRLQAEYDAANQHYWRPGAI